jgi:fatty-acyl-CoA synthase
MTLGEALEFVAGRFPKRVAMIADGKRISYRQLLQRSQALAANLHELGIRKGDRIATLMWGMPDFIYLFFSSAMLGAAIAPLPPRMRRAQMESFLRELEPILVLASNTLEIPDGLEALGVLQREMPSLRYAFVSEETSGTSQTFRDMLQPPSGVEPIRSQVQPQDLAAILYTSGTTGRPKGIMHSHRGLVGPVVASIKLREMWMSFWPTFRRLKRWARVLVRYGARLLRAAGRPQTMLSTMAIHTISGLEAMLQALLMGDRLVLQPRFHPVHVLEAIEKEKVTVLIGPPLTYLTMLHVSDFDRYRLSSLVICATGSAPCAPDLAKEIQDRFGGALHIGFGMTELGGGIAATSLEDPADRQAHTVGQPMPGMEVRIVDDQHQPLPPNTVGELACRSETLMMGYFGDRQESGELVDDHGWLYTGDLATMDEQGYIRIVGRKKDLIIRGGQNIYPSKIERVLTALDGIGEAAVVGVPDTLLGESVWAFVIPDSEVQPNTEQIMEHCRSKLEVHEIPQRIRIVDDFPRTSTAKPKKIELRKMALEEIRTHD